VLTAGVGGVAFGGLASAIMFGPKMFPSDVPILISTFIPLPLLLYNVSEVFSQRVNVFISMTIVAIIFGNLMRDQGFVSMENGLDNMPQENELTRASLHCTSVLILDWAPGTLDHFLLLGSSKVLYGFWVGCALNLFEFISTRVIQNIGREQGSEQQRQSFLKRPTVRRLGFYIIGTIVIFLWNIIATKHTLPDSTKIVTGDANLGLIILSTGISTLRKILEFAIPVGLLMPAFANFYISVLAFPHSIKV
jgi:hypothetical protein